MIFGVFWPFSIFSTFIGPVKVCNLVNGQILSVELKRNLATVFSHEAWGVPGGRPTLFLYLSWSKAGKFKFLE